MPTKQLHNSSLAADNSRQPAPPAIADSPNWLAGQARDYYRLSVLAQTPGKRAWNRKRFIEAIEQLLAVAGKERTLAAFDFLDVNTADARAVIAKLVAQPPKAPVSSPKAHSATPAAGDVSEAIRGLTAALERLLLPLAAFAGQGGK